jgi:signal peptidase I
MRNIVKKLWVNYKYLIMTIISIVLLRLYVVTPIVVAGPSMMPTLDNADKIIINKISPKVVGYDRFDVIVFNSKAGPKYVKRIIGLPGETIEFKNDQLFIDGKLIDEPYLQKSNNTEAKLTGNFTLQQLYNLQTIPDEMYFVLGDNRLNSNDSREPEAVGLIHKDDILGKAELVIFPFNHFHFLK